MIKRTCFFAYSFTNSISSSFSFNFSRCSPFYLSIFNPSTLFSLSNLPHSSSTLDLISSSSFILSLSYCSIPDTRSTSTTILSYISLTNLLLLCLTLSSLRCFLFKHQLPVHLFNLTLLFPHTLTEFLI
jgi:hypothetical protein